MFSKATSILALLLLLISCSKDPNTTPLEVKLDGNIHSNFKGFYEHNRLTLFNGKGISPEYDDPIKIIVWLEDKNHQNSTVNINKDTWATNVTIDLHDPDSNLNIDWTKEYDVTLTFGNEKDFKIPIVVQGHAKGEKNEVHFLGSFLARTKAIEMKNGILDTSIDTLETIQWLTKAKIKEKSPNAVISESVDACAMSSPYAWCSYLYTNSDNQNYILKLQFQKIESKWQIVNELDSNETFSANSLVPLFQNTPPYIFSPLASKKFESEVYNTQGGYLHISEPPVISCSGGQSEGTPGVCEIGFQRFSEPRELNSIPNVHCEFITYLLEKNSKGIWDINKTLDDSKKYNIFKNQIEQRTDNDRVVCF